MSYRLPILLSIIGVLLIFLMFQLPKSIVRDKEKSLEVQSRNDNSTKIENKKESEEMHSNISKEDEAKIISLKNQINRAKDKNLKAELIENLSSIYRQSNLLDSAAFYMSAIEDIEPNTQSWLKIGDAYLEAYRFAINPEKIKNLSEKARSYYDKILAKEPDNLEAKVKTGITFTTSKNPMQGIAMIREVLEKDPKNELAILTLGELSLQSQQYDKAQQRFEQLLSINPKSWQAMLYLAEIYANDKKKDKALELLEKVIKESKDSFFVQTAIQMKEALK
jgi:outer membrane protein